MIVSFEDTFVMIADRAEKRAPVKVEPVRSRLHPLEIRILDLLADKEWHPLAKIHNAIGCYIQHRIDALETLELIAVNRTGQRGLTRSEVCARYKARKRGEAVETVYRVFVRLA